MSDDEATYGLEMPFLPVTSRGGPFPDDAYVCGYEAGRLDSFLASMSSSLDLPNDMLLHEENAEQADLIAMRHGFTVQVMPWRGGWVLVSFAWAGPL
jgi:hypothetical protein